MMKVRNKWGEDRLLPGHGLVQKDAVVEITEAEVEGLCVQPFWEPEDAATVKVFEKAVRARRALIKAEAEARQAATPPEPVAADEDGAK